MENQGFQTTLGEIVEMKKGISYRSTELVNSEKDGILLINLKSFKKSGGFNENGLKYFCGDYDKSNLIQPDDIIIANTDLTPKGDILGSPILLPKELHSKKVAFSVDTTRYRITDERVVISYLYHLLQTPLVRIQFKKYLRGATVKRFAEKDAKKIELSFPTVEEQERIVGILDKANEIKHNSGSIPQQIEMLLRSEFDSRFGDPVLNQNTWNEVTLESLLETIIDYRGKTPPKSDNGIPLLSAANITNHKIDLSHEQYISQEDYEKWTIRGFTQPGDVLITTEAPVGQVALYPEEGIYQISRRMMALRPDSDRVDSVFLYFVLSHQNWQKRLTRILRGSTVPRVLKPDLLGQKIILPPIGKQRKFASFVLKMYSLNRLTGEKIDSNSNLCNSMIQLLNQ